jgi:hypothetical protein
VPASLPSFSRGLKLTRLAVFLMLIQIVMGLVTSLKLVSAGSPDDARDALSWLEYVMLANIVAALGMFVGVARAIPEFKRVRMQLTGLVIAAIGFAIAAAALIWTYHVITHFIDLALHPENSTFEELSSSVDDLKSLSTVAIVKDLAYGIGLIAVIRTVQRSAAINDQLALRDVAGSMSRALIVMVIGDLFWQLTYGLANGGIGVLGFIGSLLVGVYWIYCHWRLQGFLFNAAWFVNEPHNLPVAILRDADDKSGAHKAAARAFQPIARPSQPIARPSQPIARSSQGAAMPAAPPAPSAAPPLVVVAPPPRVEPPRATSTSESEADGPRFLR